MAAKSIAFKVTAAPNSGPWKISGARIGNVVDPQTGMSKWFTDPVTGFPCWSTPPAASEWIWPAPTVPFGLSFEFDVEVNGKTSTQTALGHICVDPGPLNGSDNLIEVSLLPCCTATDPSFPQLKVVVGSGPATVKPTTGQPGCRQSHVDILIAVDVAGALSANTLSGYLYMVDTAKFHGSYQQGTQKLVTRLNNGDHIVWRVTGIDPATSLTIKNFSGQAITGHNLVNLSANDVYVPKGGVWEADFQAGGNRHPIPYTMTLQFQGNKTLSSDAVLQWTQA